MLHLEAIAGLYYISYMAIWPTCCGYLRS